MFEENIGLSCAGIIWSMQGMFLVFIHFGDLFLDMGEEERPIIWIIQRRQI
jgi:hypothetical protein